MGLILVENFPPLATLKIKGTVHCCLVAKATMFPFIHSSQFIDYFIFELYEKQ